MSNQRRFALIGATPGSAAFDEGAQDAVGSILVDSSEIDFTYTDATPSITASLINGSVVFARLQNFDALSVLGRSANSAGVGDEIAAGANDRLLRRTSDTLNFGQLTAGMFPNTVVPDAALSSNVPLLSQSNTFTNVTTEFRSTGGPLLRLVDTDTTSGARNFRVRSVDNQFVIATENDANTQVETILVATSNGSSQVTQLDLSADAIQLNGVNVTDFARLSQSNTFTGETIITDKDFVVGHTAQINAAANSGRITANGSASALFQLGIGGTRVGYMGHDGTDMFLDNVDGGPVQLFSNGTLILEVNTSRVDLTKPIQLFGYTVATLPAGTQGDTAYVTDALAPAFLTAVVGGGAVVTPVFYDGTNWVAI